MAQNNESQSLFVYGYEAFIEVPVLSDGRLDRDNAIYINGKNG